MAGSFSWNGKTAKQPVSDEPVEPVSAEPKPTGYETRHSGPCEFRDAQSLSEASDFRKSNG